MARPHRAVTRIPRAVGHKVHQQMTDLWDARLGVTQAPEIGDIMWEVPVADPLAEAGTRAMMLHEQLEVPEHRSRQSRDSLRRLADLALRKAE